MAAKVLTYNSKTKLQDIYILHYVNKMFKHMLYLENKDEMQAYSIFSIHEFKIISHDKRK